MKNKKILFASASLAGVAGAFLIAKKFASHSSEDEGIDKDNPYLAAEAEVAGGEATRYGTVVKPVLDKVLGFTCLFVLSPLMFGIALLVFIDDPGPVIFKQKRVGKNGRYFMLHKFRTMGMSTPHDVPTHELRDPEKYITRVGHVLRASSLDELPQIWDIFRGRMSFIGPRPALWNQEDLVLERSKWDVNNVLPGLTGLAQIKGRDELEIPEKAKLDGEYVKVLRLGGRKAFAQDCRLLFGTVVSVLKHDGVVEGGTGTAMYDDSQAVRTKEMGLVNPDDAGFEDYGFKKAFCIDKGKPVKVLITGSGSYIGDSFLHYCEEHYPNIEITIIDMVDSSWRSYDFTPFDTVFHVAGIAHVDVGKVADGQKAEYYEVNRDLAIECAKKSRDASVRQFIYMSSMIVYGRQEFVDEGTVPSPANFYGDSKWQGDVGVRKLESEDFHVAVLRPPMIYGRGSKGNYPLLSKIARRIPVFPEIDNKRSMLYVENLCEFVGQLICSGEGGVYFPQNAEYVKTSDMIRCIAAVSNKKILTSRALKPAVFLAKRVPGKTKGLADKAFGSSYYDQRLSHYDGLEYCKVGMEESIKRTERL